MLPLKSEQFFTEFVYSMMGFTNTDIIFICNGKKWEESKIAERQRKCAREGGWQ
jgi:hypothetical protein